jgi:hypothetical protein
MPPKLEERLSTREVEMKKYLFIIVLCSALGACVSSPGARTGDSDLLSFTDLANEITVGFEERRVKPERQAEIEGPLGTP